MQYPSTIVVTKGKTVKQDGEAGRLIGKQTPMRFMYASILEVKSNSLLLKSGKEIPCDVPEFNDDLTFEPNLFVLQIRHSTKQGASLVQVA